MAGMKLYEPAARGPHKGETRFRCSWRNSAGKQLSRTKYGRSNAKRFKRDIERGFINRDTGKYFDEEQAETKRQIVAGIAAQYQPEELKGKQIVVLANLEPKTFLGVESQGMLLAADSSGLPVLLTPERKVPSGIEIK